MPNHQVKSRWYYIFWGLATVTVFAGQLYVGTGYREMAKQTAEFNRIFKVRMTEPSRSVPSLVPTSQRR